MKQLRVLVFAFDILKNPFDIICGLTETVESFFFMNYIK